MTSASTSIPTANSRSARKRSRCVEITGLNPQVTTLFAGNVVLDQVGQTLNVASFDLTYDGQVRLTDPPLEPITHAYERTK
jgi:hypothetical protein